MLHPALSQALATAHARELHLEARRGRLARLAACCRPSYLAQRLAALRERLARHDQTAPVCCS